MCNPAYKNFRHLTKSFENLPYNHDGEGGLPIRPDVIEFLDDFLFSFDDLFLGVPEFEVKLSPDGTVEAGFGAEGDRQLLLTFPCEGVIAYIKVFPDLQTTVEGVIRLDFHAYGDETTNSGGELIALFRWIKESE